MIQGSDEWKAARCGKVTASRVADVIAKTKTGWGTSRANYMAELIAERMTNLPADSYTSFAMQWGLDHEAEAADAYAFYADAELQEVGYVEHSFIEQTGASPDRLVSDVGLVEIKCPNTATHIDTLLGQAIPANYVTQMFWQMACTGRQWCDYVSYDPRMPEPLRLFVKRLARDNAAIADLESAVTAFLSELDAKQAALTALMLRTAP